jgi:exopolysaccharide/PEP-CTERM locus tyrosine autokinase
MGKIYEALMRAEEKEEEQPADPGALVTGGNGFSPELMVVGRPGSAIAEQFRFLRSKLIKPETGKRPRTLLITSALQGEGKTFVASNLAATLAQGLDEYVLLVDADMRNPRVHKVFGYDRTSQGLSSHLTQDIPLENVLRNTSVGKLTVLPAGEDIENPVELLSSTKMKGLIAEVRDRYPDRFVIFDSPPMELAPETLVLAKEVDGIYLVVLRAKTPRDVVSSTLERFHKDKFMGVILNGYEKQAKYYKKYKKNGYGSGYGRGYSYGYGYGYGYGKKKAEDSQS